MRTVAAYFVFLLPLLLGASDSSSTAMRQVFTGEEKALWLVLIRGDNKPFDLLIRPAGGRWQWVATDLNGSIATALAAYGRLHVVFRSGQYHIFSLSSREGVPGIRLPAAPVTLCEGTNFGLSDAPALVAIVPRAATAAHATSTPATMAATPAADGAAQTKPSAPPLDIIQNVNGNWERLTTLTGVPAESAAGLRAAVVSSTLYVLVPGKENRLTAWKEDKWRDLPLRPTLASSKVPGMIAMDDRMVVVSTREDEDKQDRLEITTFSTREGVLPAQAVNTDGEIAYWPSGNLLAVSRLADKLAILWREDGLLKLATCSPATGQLDPAEDLSIIDRPPTDDLSRHIHVYFAMGLLLAIVVLLFLVKPQSAPKPFTMPPTAWPAPLGRRLGAIFIDLVPFNFAAWLIFRLFIPVSPEGLQEILADALAGREHALPLPILITSIGAILAYLAYCIIMEKTRGATIGKMILRLRVIGDEGVRPGLREVALRNLLKIIETSWFPPLLLVPLITRYRQRLGDLVAHTAVIDASFTPAPRADDGKGDKRPGLNADSDEIRRSSDSAL